MKPYNSTRLLLLVTLLLTACAHQPMQVKHDVEVEQLEICLTFHEQIVVEDRLLHLDAIKNFIDDYNHAGQKINLLACQQGTSKSLNIAVESAKFINPEKQLLYVLASAVGLYYPLTGGGIGFAWLGFNTTNVGLSLSDDLDPGGKPVFRSVVSSPYFHELETVKARHMQKFQVFMFEVMQEIESKKISKV